MNGGEEKEREEKKSQSDVSDLHAILHVRKVQVMETMSQKLMWARNLPNSKHGLLTRDQSIRHVPCQLHTMVQVQLMTSSILASLFTLLGVHFAEFARRRCSQQELVGE